VKRTFFVTVALGGLAVGGAFAYQATARQQDYAAFLTRVDLVDRFEDGVRRNHDRIDQRLQRATHVVDLGCGEGATTRLLARRGAKVTGIDLSPRMITLAQQEEAREPLHIDYRVASYAARTAFPAERFEAAVSTMALMDSADFAAAARETFRLLKPASPFIFSVLHPCFVTPGIRWLQDENGDQTELIVSRYFDEDPYIEHRRFSKDPSVARAVTLLWLGWPYGSPRPVSWHLTQVYRGVASAPADVSESDRLMLDRLHATRLLFCGDPAGWHHVDRIPDLAGTQEVAIQALLAHVDLTYAAMLWGHYERADHHAATGGEVRPGGARR